MLVYFYYISLFITLTFAIVAFILTIAMIKIYVNVLRNFRTTNRKVKTQNNDK